LAARPDKRLSIVWFAVLYILNLTLLGKQIAPAIFSTLDSRQYSLIFQKQKHPRGVLLVFGAGERGHSLHTSTSIKSHHFTRFSGILGHFCVIFYALPDLL